MHPVHMIVLPFTTTLTATCNPPYISSFLSQEQVPAILLKTKILWERSKDCDMIQHLHCPLTRLENISLQLPHFFIITLK